jgi:hypothetical protein
MPGPFTNSYSFVGFNCDGFAIQITGTETFSVDVYWDASGNVARVLKHDSAPADRLTNLTTGASILVRAHYGETMIPTPGTDDGTKTIVGFRYMVNEPGSGATIREGRSRRVWGLRADDCPFGRPESMTSPSTPSSTECSVRRSPDQVARRGQDCSEGRRPKG